ncbi:Hint domain-containing protein [Nereida sp. MMG025]|uniref:Hint domain-containing protein n=1 Tax=Nereida sp. MMG025 TaxID=2909981 RepID=UPI001F34BF8E|nr:Hint domain-containing protein [Nereida sp. MMG025]MCF6444187.1 Hint domain-containing protein [Nereida sp. MMG025]
MDGTEFFNLPDAMGGLGPGSYVMTTQGELPVEWLEVGDRLITRDHGAQPIQWIGRLRADNQLGVDLPNPVKLPVPNDGTSRQTDPLYLSPGHRVLLQSPLVAKHFGTTEAMCRIVDVSRRNRVRFQSVSTRLIYHHLLLPVASLILVNGLWVETINATDCERLDIPAVLRAQATQTRAPRMVLCPWEARLIRVLAAPEVNIRDLLQAA